MAYIAYYKNMLNWNVYLCFVLLETYVLNQNDFFYFSTYSLTVKFGRRKHTYTKLTFAIVMITTLKHTK